MIFFYHSKTGTRCLRNVAVNFFPNNFKFCAVMKNYSFKFTYFSIADVMDIKKGILFKKIRNHSQPVELQKKHESSSHIYITGRL